MLVHNVVYTLLFISKECILAVHSLLKITKAPKIKNKKSHRLTISNAKLKLASPNFVCQNELAQ